MREYFVYILTNKGRTVLYTGVSCNLERRVDENGFAGKQSSFTARYNVNKLVYYERYQSIDHAIAREKEIKKWRREKKVWLIEKMNPHWEILYEFDNGE